MVDENTAEQTFALTRSIVAERFYDPFWLLSRW